MKKILEEMLELSKNKLDYASLIFDEARNDGSEQFAKIASYSIFRQVQGVNSILRNFAIINGYKKDDFDGFNLASNCLGFLSEVCKNLDITYPLIAELKKDSNKLVSRLRNNYSIDSLSKELNRDYGSWSDLLVDIERLSDTFIKVGSLYLIDFIKFADFYFDNFQQIIFDKSEFEQAEAIISNLVTITRTLFDKRGSKPYYKRFGIIPSIDLPLWKLKKNLKNVKVNRFRLIKGNAWDSLEKIIISSFSVAEKEYNSKINYVQEILKVLEERAPHLNKFYLSLRKDDKSFLDELIKGFGKIRVKNKFVSTDLVSWYHMIQHDIRFVYDLLFSVYHDDNTRQNFGLPSYNSEPDKDKLDVDLVSKLGQDYSLRIIDDCVKSISIADGIIHKFIDDDLEKPISFNGLNLELILEVNESINDDLVSISGILGGLGVDELAPDELLPYIIRSMALTRLLSSCSHADLTKWREFVDIINASFSQTNNWVTAEAAIKIQTELIDKTYRLSKNDCVKIDSIFLIDELYESFSDISSQFDSLSESIKVYSDKKTLWEYSKSHMPSINHELFSNVELSEEELIDIYDLEAEILKQLLIIQGDIISIKLPKIVYKESPSKRFKCIRNNEISLFYEREALAKWAYILDEGCNIDGLNLWHYKGMLKDIKSAIKGQKILQRQQAHRNKLK